MAVNLEDRKEHQKVEQGTKKPKPRTIIEQLNEYQSCKDWMKSLKAPATKKTYPPHIQWWIKFLSAELGKPITPDMLVKMRHSEIRDYVFKYVFHLMDVAKKHAGKGVKGEISVNSIPNFILGIKSWLDYNEIPTPYWKKLKKMLPEKVTSKIRPYEIEEVERMYKLGDIFDRLSICLFVAGGERVGGQEGLTFRNVVELPIPEGIELPAGLKIGMMSVYSDSEKHQYYVPLNTEAMAQIESTRQFRLAKGERITPDSPLVRDKLPKNEPLSNKINRPKAVKAGTIRRRMKKLLVDAGLPVDELQPDHSFRYLFNES